MYRLIISIVVVALILASRISGQEGGTILEYGDIVMNTKQEAMEKAKVKPVVFPHWFHRIRYKCKVCHNRLFIMEKGANDINMDRIMRGEYCGRCHNGIVAWEPLYCDRCHYYTPQRKGLMP